MNKIETWLRARPLLVACSVCALSASLITVLILFDGIFSPNGTTVMLNVFGLLGIMLMWKGAARLRRTPLDASHSD